MLLVVRETLLQQITLFSTFLTQDELARKSEKMKDKLKKKRREKEEAPLVFHFLNLLRFIFVVRKALK